MSGWASEGFRDVAMPSLDSDGDGLPDAQELLAPFDSAHGTRDTDPHDPASVLRLSQLDKTPPGCRCSSRR